MAAATANGTTTSTHTNGTSNGATPPKIHLYTNHLCPYAHRAHIVLEELNLPFEETIIDLSTARPQWYLDINPRGLVPSMRYSVPGIVDDEIITESAIVAQFLADSFPSPLLPSTREDPTAPLRRARINFFTDTWNNKIASHQYPIMRATSDAERDEKVQEWLGAIKKEIEPLLADAGPFFGGSQKLTFAEAIVAPFVLRWYSLGNDEAGLLPKAFIKGLDALPNFGPWAKAVREHESVLKIYDEKKTMEGMVARMQKMQGAK